MYPCGADRVETEQKKKPDVKRSVTRLCISHCLPTSPTPHANPSDRAIFSPPHHQSSHQPNGHYRRRLSSSLYRHLIEFADSVGTPAHETSTHHRRRGVGARECPAHTTSVPATNIRRSRHRRRRHTCPSISPVIRSVEFRYNFARDRRTRGTSSLYHHYRTN